MRKIDIIANEKFNGNTIEALHYLLDSDIKLGEYREELNVEELKYVMNYVTNKVAIKKYGNRENLAKAAVQEIKLKSLNLTEEEVRNAKKNPYKAKMSKSFLKLLLTEGGIVSLALAGKNLGIEGPTLGVIGSALTAFMSYGVAENIIKYLKFRSLKKNIDNNLFEKTDEINKGRSL